MGAEGRGQDLQLEEGLGRALPIHAQNFEPHFWISVPTKKSRSENFQFPLFLTSPRP